LRCDHPAIYRRSPIRGRGNLSPTVAAPRRLARAEPEPSVPRQNRWACAMSALRQRARPFASR
jgi:hypothetical protein